MSLKNTDIQSFIDRVRHSLGMLADACLCAFEENGDERLEEAANALRAVECVARIDFRPDMIGNSKGRSAIIECLDTIKALQEKDNRESPMPQEAKDTTEEEVIGIVTHFIGLGYTPDEQRALPPISVDTRLREDLDFDPLDIVELIIEIETKYDFFLKEDDCDNLKTIGDVVQSVRRAKALFEDA